MEGRLVVTEEVREFVKKVDKETYPEDFIDSLSPPVASDFFLNNSGRRCDDILDYELEE